MYDKTLIIDSLLDIEDALLYIVKRTESLNDVNDFTNSQSGMDMYDAATIRLMAIGESINKIDKRTDEKLFANYPDIEWKKIIGMRNYIAHTYFRVDAAIIFDAVKNKVNPLLTTVQQIITDLENEEIDENRK
jgi:uncharacterized protein with HEPN domain